MKKILFLISSYLVLCSMANATLITGSINNSETLSTYNGSIEKDYTATDPGAIISVFDNNAIFNYPNQVNIATHILENPKNDNKEIEAIFTQGNIALGKTTIAVDVADGIDTKRRINIGRIYGFNPSLSFTDGSTFTINGNGKSALRGFSLDGGLYSDKLPNLLLSLGNDTTINLHNAGSIVNDDGSWGLYTFLEGTHIQAGHNLTINIDSDHHKMIGIYTYNDTDDMSPEASSEVTLNGKTTINMTNGGDYTWGIFAEGKNSTVLAKDNVNIYSHTDANAWIAGVYAYNSSLIEFQKQLNVDLKTGDVDSSSAVLANTQGRVILNGADLKIHGASSLVAYDDGIIEAKPGVYKLDGSIWTYDGGQINLNMTDGSHFTGSANTYSDDATINLTASGANTVWSMNDDSLISSLTLTDGARIDYASVNSGTFTPQNLVVKGNYTANNGQIRLNTVLEGDDAQTDHFIVKGDTQGHTDVIINNVGGKGAQTQEGIEVISVNGDSAGNFALLNNEPVRAGAYDYDLKKNDKNWYLTSFKHGDKGEPIKPMIRPETGSYIANLAAANTLFNHRLHDRLGEPYYTDAFTGAKTATSMWMRHVGGHTRFRDTADGKNQTNRYVLQLGGDVAQWTTQAGHRYHLGLMAGYAHASNSNTSRLTQRSSDGTVSGYSVGLYGTWYQKADVANTGAYVDSWLLYNWFDNEVKRYADEEKYDAKGVTASVEVGYTFLMGQQGNSRYYLQPQAQVTYMGVHADDHWDAQKTHISSGKDNIETRLGLRAYINGYNEAIDSNRERQFQPFVEVNWLYHANDFDARFNGVKVEQEGWRNVGEIKLGTEGQINRNFNLLGSVAQQIGDKGYSDTQAELGLKYTF